MSCSALIWRGGALPARIARAPAWGRRSAETATWATSICYRFADKEIGRRTTYGFGVCLLTVNPNGRLIEP